MLAGQSQRLVKLVPPSVDALARAGIDQIEREPGKITGSTVDGGDRLGSVVEPSEQTQPRRVERLDAER